MKEIMQDYGMALFYAVVGGGILYCYVNQLNSQILFLHLIQNTFEVPEGFILFRRLILGGLLLISDFRLLAIDINDNASIGVTCNSMDTQVLDEIGQRQIQEHVPVAVHAHGRKPAKVSVMDDFRDSFDEAVQIPQPRRDAVEIRNVHGEQVALVTECLRQTVRDLVVFFHVDEVVPIVILTGTVLHA